MRDKPKSIKLAILSLIILLSFMPLLCMAEASWTFMVYLDADNNLEGAGIEDFLEMAQIGSDSNINIVVLFDRVEGWDTSYGDWDETRRGIVQYGDIPDASWGGSIGEANMGDPKTLSDFAIWAIGQYPAQRYALILWNHGGGWREAMDGNIPPLRAVCWDDTNGGDCLEMNEVETALAAIESTAAEVTLVGFDACLMGMVEVAYEVCNHAQVMVASEESEPWDGWPYDTLLADLVANPAMSASELGTVIVDRYYESYGNSLTQSAIDLTQMSGLASTVSNFAQIMIDHWYDDTDAVKAAAEAVKTQLNAAVIHEQHGSGWPGSHGLSIYWCEQSYINPYYNGMIINFPADTQWEEFLAEFYTSMSRSWINKARRSAQDFCWDNYVDLYDFCDKLCALDCCNLVVSPASLSLKSQYGTTVNTSVTVREMGGMPALNVVATCPELASDTGNSIPAADITIDVPSDTIPPNEQMTIGMTINTPGVSNLGQYTGALGITSSGGDLTVPISLHVVNFVDTPELEFEHLEVSSDLIVDVGGQYSSDFSSAGQAGTIQFMAVQDEKGRVLISEGRLLLEDQATTLTFTMKGKLKLNRKRNELWLKLKGKGSDGAGKKFRLKASGTVDDELELYFSYKGKGKGNKFEFDISPRLENRATGAQARFDELIAQGKKKRRLTGFVVVTLPFANVDMQVTERIKEFKKSGKIRRTYIIKGNKFRLTINATMDSWADSRLDIDSVRCRIGYGQIPLEPKDVTVKYF